MPESCTISKLFFKIKSVSDIAIVYNCFSKIMEPKINIALKAARLAGKEISKFSRRKDKIKISEKGPTDFVTQVDKIAEKIIIETIKQSFPNSAFEGEELGKSGKEDAKLLWVIDPLDGTTNFIHGFPYYSVSIACYENGI